MAPVTLINPTSVAFAPLLKPRASIATTMGAQCLITSSCFPHLTRGTGKGEGGTGKGEGGAAHGPAARTPLRWPQRSSCGFVIPVWSSMVPWSRPVLQSGLIPHLPRVSYQVGYLLRHFRKVFIRFGLIELHVALSLLVKPDGRRSGIS